MCILLYFICLQDGDDNARRVYCYYSRKLYNRFNPLLLLRKPRQPCMRAAVDRTRTQLSRPPTTRNRGLFAYAAPR